MNFSGAKTSDGNAGDSARAPRGSLQNTTVHAMDSDEGSDDDSSDDDDDQAVYYPQDGQVSPIPKPISKVPKVDVSAANSNHGITDGGELMRRHNVCLTLKTLC